MYEAALKQPRCLDLEGTAQILQQNLTYSQEVWRDVFQHDSLTNRQHIKCNPRDCELVEINVTQDKQTIIIGATDLFGEHIPKDFGMSRIIVSGLGWETATLKVGQTVLSQIHRCYGSKFELLEGVALFDGSTFTLEIDGTIGSTHYLRFSITRFRYSMFKPPEFRATFPCTKVLQVSYGGKIQTVDLPTNRIEIMSQSGSPISDLELCVSYEGERIGKILPFRRFSERSCEIVFQPNPIVARADFFLEVKGGMPLSKDLVIIQEMFNVLVIKRNVVGTLYEIN